MLPSSLISLLIEFTFFWTSVGLSIFSIFCTLFGVSSYSSHILLIIWSSSSCILDFFKSTLDICSLTFSNILFSSINSCSNFSCLLVFSILSSLSFSILPEESKTFLSSSFIFSSTSIIFFSKLSFSTNMSSLIFFLFSILLTLFDISKSILSIISFIELSLSSNDDTEIFKFVISKFKSSIYFWLSLFEIVNSSIILLVLVFSSSISSTFLFNFSIILFLASISTLFSSTSFFSLSSLASSFNISKSTFSCFCFSVA